jgi:hypothetical protein
LQNLTHYQNQIFSCSFALRNFANAKIKPKHCITKHYMDLQQRINAFTKLGEFLCQFKANEIKKDDAVIANDLFFDGFKHQLKIAKEHNGWFTEKNIMFSIESWSNALNSNNIRQWVSNYSFMVSNPKNIAIITTIPILLNFPIFSFS